MDTLSRRELFKKYSYGLINTEDIDEIQNLFDYASGIIVKDEDLANRYETTISARNGNTYIKACYRQDDYTETQREKLKGMYEESNRYYRWLLDDYNIDPLTSRTAEDYQILKSINTTDKNGRALLTDWQEELFLKCYKESLTYWNNVTRTKSFKNEESYRQFSEVYLLFMAIQRYITYRMKSQFDVDTFTKFQCKNYFISNGVDYFDSLPLEYQRRLIKLLNDMQRDKGDDKVFDYIKDVLQVNNLNIYKYVLTKKQPTKDSKGELTFYKVPYDEELNTDTNETYSFESITEDDPYWRASKDEILYQKFNTLDTKYISLEYIIDMIKNGRALSYFMYLLNDAMLADRNAENKTSLRFFDKNISSNPIKLYDAMMALYSLFYTYIKNDHFEFNKKPADAIDSDGDGYYKDENNIKDGMYNDIELEDGTIIDNDPDSKLKPGVFLNTEGLNPLIVDVYGYSNYKNNQIIKDKIKEIIKIIDEENIQDSTSQLVISWNNKLKEFLNYEFNLRDFHYSDNFTFKAIESFYNNPNGSNIGTTKGNVRAGGMTVKSEFLELARFINAVEIYNTKLYKTFNSAKKEFDLYKNVLHDNIKDSLKYVLNLILNKDLALEFLDIHPNLKRLFKKYVAYLIINGETFIRNEEVDINNINYYNEKFDIFYNMLISNEKILEEFIDYSHELYGYEVKYLEKFIQTYHTQEGLGNFINFINLVQHTFFTDDALYKYRNLKVFLEIFSALKNEIYNKKLNNKKDINGLTNLVSEYSDIKISEFMQILNENEKVRAKLEGFIAECNSRKIYNSLRELWSMKFKSDFNFDIYGQFESFKEYLLNNDEELYNFVTEFGEFDNDSDRRSEIENRILELSSAIETYIKSDGGIVYNSTFNVIFSDIKEYALLLINVFKAYTLDTIYSGNVLNFNDPLDERVKIFDDFGDNPDEFITDLEFEAPPEYFDLQDDIRKDNGDLDVSYNLLIRNLIKNNLNDDEENPDKNDEYLKYIKVEGTIMESNENLPYGVTSLRPDEFKKLYGDVTLPSTLGLTTKKLYYVERSYEYTQEFRSETPIDVDYINQISLSAMIEAKNKYFLISSILPDDVSKIRNDRFYLDKNKKRIYSKNKEQIYGEDIINLKDSSLWTLDEELSKGLDEDNQLFYVNILDYESNTNFIASYIEKVIYNNPDITEEEDKFDFYLWYYDYDKNDFVKLLKLPTKYTYRGCSPSYISKYGMDQPISGYPFEDYFYVYYDPYVTAGITGGKYFIDPLNGIFNNYENDSDREKTKKEIIGTKGNENTDFYFNIKKWAGFARLTYNDDLFVKYFGTERGIKYIDNRREQLFYLRESRNYSWYDGNLDRLQYNKCVLPPSVLIPTLEYVDYLNENNLVNGNYIYQVAGYEDQGYLIPIEDGISGIYTLDKEKFNSNLSGIKRFTLRGNEVKNIELELGKEYYLTAFYNFTEVIKMYEKIYLDSGRESEYYPNFELYLKLNEEITNPFVIGKDANNKDIITTIEEIIRNAGNIISIDLVSTTIVNNKTEHIYKIIGNVKNKDNISFAKNNIDSLFNIVDSLLNNIGSSLKDENEKGYNAEHPFIHYQDLVDEITKYRVIFIVDNDDEYGNTEYCRYSHEYKETNGIYNIGYGFSLNTGKNKAAILYEPLRFYHHESYKDKDGHMLIADKNKIEKLPYYIDTRDNSITLEPSPYLKGTDKSDLISMPVNGDNYLLALHQTYSNRQFTDYNIAISEQSPFAGTNLLTDKFISIKKINTKIENSKQYDTYDYVYEYDKINEKDKKPFEITNPASLELGVYSYLLTTSYKHIGEGTYGYNPIKFKIPSTINDNAWLLTFYNSIEKPDDSTELTFNISDTFKGTSNFAFIAVKNKGITDYNSKANEINRPFLSAIKRLNNDYNILGKKINTLNEAASLLNNNNAAYTVVNSSIKEEKDYEFINLYSNDEYLDYYRFKEYNDITDINSNYRRNIRKNADNTYSAFLYDFNECKSYNEIEEVIDSGLVELNEYGNTFEDLLNLTRIIILNSEKEIVYTNFDIDEDDRLNYKENFYNNTNTISSLDDDIIRKNNTYYMIIESSYLNILTDNGNFLVSVDIDDDPSSNNYTHGVTIEPYKYNNKDCIVRTKVFRDSGKLKGTTSILKCYTIKPFDKDCHIGLKISGILSFEYCVNYNTNNEKIILEKPTSNTTNMVYYNKKGINWLRDYNLINLTNDKVYFSNYSLQPYLTITKYNDKINSSTINNGSYNTINRTWMYTPTTDNDEYFSQHTTIDNLSLLDFPFKDNSFLFFDFNDYEFKNCIKEFLNITEDIYSSYRNNILNTKLNDSTDEVFKSNYKFNYELADNIMINGKTIDEIIEIIKLDPTKDYENAEDWIKRKLLYNYIKDQLNADSIIDKPAYGFKLTYNDSTILGTEALSTSGNSNIINKSNQLVYNIELPSDTISVASYSFKNSFINKITFSPIFIEINDHSFQNSRLKNIYFQNNEYIFKDNEIDQFGRIKINIINEKKIDKNTINLNNQINTGFLIIDSHAFDGCRMLQVYNQTIFFPLNLSVIKSRAFIASNITGINFDRCFHLFNIQEYAFSRCHYLGRRYIIDSKTNEPVKNSDGYYIFENEVSTENDITKDLVNGHTLIDFEGYKEEYYETINTAHDNELEFGKLKDGYTFSITKPLILPHGENYSFISIGNHCFYDNTYLRIVDTGNIYELPYRTFCNNIRLTKVMLPEVIFVGCEIVNGSVSGFNYYFSDFYYFDENNIPIFSYRDGKGGYSHYITVDNKGNMVPRYGINSQGFSQKIIYKNKEYPVQKQNKNKPDDEILNISGDDFEYDNRSDGLVGDYTITKKDKFKEKYNAVIKTDEGVIIVLYIFDDTKLINKGYESKNTYNKTAIDSISQVFMNCKSLIEVDFSEKLESLMPYSFENIATLYKKLNTNNIYLLSNDNIISYYNKIGSLKEFDSFEELPYYNPNPVNPSEEIKNTFSFIKLKNQDGNKYKDFKPIYLDNENFIYGLNYVYDPYGNNRTNTGTRDSYRLCHIIINDNEFIKNFKYKYFGTNDQWSRVKKLINWNMTTFASKYDTSKYNVSRNSYNTDHIKEVNKGFYYKKANNSKSFNIPLFDNYKVYTIKNSGNTNININNVFDHDYDYELITKTYNNGTIYPIDEEDSELTSQVVSTSEAYGYLIYGISEKLKNLELDDAYKLVLPLNDSRQIFMDIPFLDKNKYFTETLADDRLKYVTENNIIGTYKQLTGKNVTLKDSNLDLNIYGYNIQDSVERIESGKAELTGIDNFVNNSYNNFAILQNEINTQKNKITNKISYWLIDLEDPDKTKCKDQQNDSDNYFGRILALDNDHEQLKGNKYYFEGKYSEPLWNNETSPAIRKPIKDKNDKYSISDDRTFGFRTYNVEDKYDKKKYLNDIVLMYTKNRSEIKGNMSDYFNYNDNGDFEAQELFGWSFKIQSDKKSNNNYYRYFLDCREISIENYITDKKSGYYLNADYFYKSDIQDIFNSANNDNNDLNAIRPYLKFNATVDNISSGSELSYSYNYILLDDSSAIYKINNTIPESVDHYLFNNNVPLEEKTNILLTPENIYNTHITMDFFSSNRKDPNIEYGTHNWPIGIPSIENTHAPKEYFDLNDNTVIYSYESQIPRIGLFKDPYYIPYNSQNEDNKYYSAYKHLIKLPGRLFDRMFITHMYFNISKTNTYVETNDIYNDSLDTNPMRTNIVSRIHSIIMKNNEIIGYEVNGFSDDNDNSKNDRTGIIRTQKIYKNADNIDKEVYYNNREYTIYKSFETNENNEIIENGKVKLTYGDVLNDLINHTTINNNTAYIHIPNGTVTIELINGKNISLNSDNYTEYSI